MITGNHVREELDKAMKIISSIKEASLEAIIKLQKLIVKLLTVVIKIVINNRTNTKKIMDKLDIKDNKIQIIKSPVEEMGNGTVYTKVNLTATNKIEIDQDIIDNIKKGEQL